MSEIVSEINVALLFNADEYSYNEFHWSEDDFIWC